MQSCASADGQAASAPRDDSALRTVEMCVSEVDEEECLKQEEILEIFINTTC